MKRGLFVTGFLLLMAGCATSSRSEPAAAPRSKDSRDTVPDKIAAQRAASGNLRLEDEDNRWGFEAAREHRRPHGAPAATTVIPMPRAGIGGSPDAGALGGGMPDAGVPRGTP